MLRLLFHACLAKPEFDVLVIGGGWSGMAAAHHLARHNVSFAVLEANNWTGGRSHATQFGDASVREFIVELGSNWVHGVGGGAAGALPDKPNVPENPVHVLAREANLSMVLIPGSSQNMSNYAAVLDVNGVDADPAGQLRTRANQAYDCVNTTTWNHSESFRDALTVCGWQPGDAVEWAMDWVLSEDDPGEPASTQSATGWGLGFRRCPSF